MQTYIKVLALTFSPHSEYVPNKFYFIKIIPLCHYLLKGTVHLQLKILDNALLISELKKPYMNGFTALLQYKRMIEECLIRFGTGEIESIKRITTNGVQEIRKVHVTMRNVLNILISRFSRALWLVFLGSPSWLRAFFVNVETGASDISCTCILVIWACAMRNTFIFTNTRKNTGRI